MSWVSDLARPDIVALQAYEHAAWEPDFDRLHANELPWRSDADDSRAGLNRYPEPQPRQLVARLAGLYAVAPESVLVGRGSDEAIDLLTRGFCRAGEDRVVICPPTFGMYCVAAGIQGATVVNVPLLASSGFALDVDAVLARCDSHVKLVFLCSPNNPTGNLLGEPEVLRLAKALEGRALLVIDEAYLEFCAAASFARHLPTLPHLAILRTLSKAYALAGARCGALIASPEVIALLRKVIPPYAIAQLSLEAVMSALEPGPLEQTRARLAVLALERTRVQRGLETLATIDRIWPSAANFLLVRCADPARALRRAREARLLVRDVRNYPGLDRCLRITIGAPAQNDRLLEALQ